MSRRIVAMVVIGVLALSIIVVAGLLAAGARTPKAGDFNRCLTTCSTLMKHYATQRPIQKAHEGDKQCWQTCDNRFNQGRNARNEPAMKAYWMKQKATNLHPNQCAQACWRRFHHGSNLVNLKGLQSEPRTVGCAPGSRALASRVPD